jgi:hypothetical protein
VVGSYVAAAPAFVTATTWSSVQTAASPPEAIAVGGAAIVRQPSPGRQVAAAGAVAVSLPGTSPLQTMSASPVQTPEVR